MVKTFITLTLGACTLKLFTAVIVEVSQQGRVFPAAINFQPSLIIAGKAGALLEWSYLWDSTYGRLLALPTNIKLACM